MSTQQQQFTWEESKIVDDVDFQAKDAEIFKSLLDKKGQIPKGDASSRGSRLAAQPACRGTKDGGLRPRLRPRAAGSAGRYARLPGGRAPRPRFAEAHTGESPGAARGERTAGGPVPLPRYVD